MASSPPEVTSELVRIDCTHGFLKGTLRMGGLSVAFPISFLSLCCMLLTADDLEVLVCDNEQTRFPLLLWSFPDLLF